MELIFFSLHGAFCVLKRYDVLVAAHGLNGSAKKCWSITRLKEMIMEEEADAVDAFSEDDFKLS